MTMASNGTSSHELLEQRFAQYTGANHAIACSSGTAALALALMSLGIKAGDEVIIPEFTMIACAYACTFVGAKPVFVDCKTDLTINPRLVEQAITPKTKAVMAVHIYGRVCDMKELKRICTDYNLYLIEDCAEAHGAMYDGKMVGTIGDVGCFSFYKNKIIHGEEGGMVTTNIDRVAEQARDCRSMGFGSKHNYLHAKLAFNFRMADLLAEPILESLRHVEENQAKRRQIEAWYDEKLEPFISTHITRLPKRAVVWVYDLCVDAFKDDLVDFLVARGIKARHFFKPMSWQPPYKRDAGQILAADYADVGLYLPVDPDMNEFDVNHIIDKIRLFYAKKQR